MSEDQSLGSLITCHFRSALDTYQHQLSELLKLYDQHIDYLVACDMGQRPKAGAKRLPYLLLNARAKAGEIWEENVLFCAAPAEEWIESVGLSCSEIIEFKRQFSPDKFAGGYGCLMELLPKMAAKTEAIKVLMERAEVKSDAAKATKRKSMPDSKPDEPGGRPPVLLHGRNLPVIVKGKSKDLNSAQYDVIERLVQSRPLGLTKDSIERIHTDARGILRRLRKDPDWAQVIHMAAITGGRYRID